MQKIHQLSSLVIAKIAAGEVIERPSYAVKELLENAIDAHATDVSILLEDAGLKKIAITDNGEGMSEEDVLECSKPHTTSKISDENELVGIKTLGFRGEALSSIAAVSKLTIKSRINDLSQTNDSIGNQIEIDNGKFTDIKPVGMQEGTTVIVEDLFNNIPARKKFLKSTQTELRHIVEVITKIALAHPEIHLNLIHNKRTLLDLPKNQNILERISQILGEETASFLLPITAEDAYIKISGFVAKPQFNSKTQNKQFIFVNNRIITDKLISLAVKEAFGTLLESNSYPLFVLFINLPFDMVDINVHPRKEIISFINPSTIFQIIKTEIIKLLSENNLTFQNISWQKEFIGTTKSHAANILRNTILENETIHFEQQSQLTQIHKTYIIQQIQRGILITDQHAAHERILFEKLIKEFEEKRLSSKTLKLKNPIILELLPEEQIILEEYTTELKNSGFFTTNNMLTHIPELLKDRSADLIFKELLSSLQENDTDFITDSVSHKMLAFLACRAAVKAGDLLPQEDMKEILFQLQTTPNKTTCPHGRPTQIELSKDSLDRMFKRI